MSPSNGTLCHDGPGKSTTLHEGMAVPRLNKIVLVLCFCFIEMISYNSQMGNKKIEKWRNFFLENERRKGPKKEKESKVRSLPH